MRPAQAFSAWIQKQVDDLSPGSQLPVATDLARQWDLSVSTVRNILRSFHRKGLLVCIPGRGTFVPQSEPLEETTAPQSSSDAIVDFVLQSIGNAGLKRGEALPSIKFMSLRFHVAPATVIKAYQSLVKEGIVTKVGKTFWVGTRESFIRPSTRRKVYFFNYESTDFRNVFRNDWMAPAYQKMERELRAHGFHIHYESTSELNALLTRSIAKQRWAHGFIFHKLREDRFAGVGRILKRRYNEMKTQQLPILVDWREGNHKVIPKGANILSRGNLYTTRARAIARYVFEKGYEQVWLLYDEQKRDFGWLLSFIRMRSELEALNSTAEFRVWVKPRKAGSSPEAFFGRIQKSRPPDWLSNIIMGKYRRVPFEEIKAMFGFTPDFEQACRLEGKKRILLFMEDRSAAQALDWARSHSVRVPEDLAVMTFENDPRYLHLGLSCCVPDWERIGYLMAHAIIGDFRIERTGKGFIRLSADVLERGTS